MRFDERYVPSRCAAGVQALVGQYYEPGVVLLSPEASYPCAKATQPRLRSAYYVVDRVGSEKKSGTAGRCGIHSKAIKRSEEHTSELQSHS